MVYTPLGVVIRPQYVSTLKYANPSLSRNAWNGYGQVAALLKTFGASAQAPNEEARPLYFIHYPPFFLMKT